MNYFSHTRPNGSSCFSLYDEAGLDYRAAGENIAAGYYGASAVVDGWMNSTGHRANILSESYDYLATGYATGGSLRYELLPEFSWRLVNNKKERGNSGWNSPLRYKMRKIRTIIGTVLCAMVLALGNRMPVMAEEVVSEELKAADTLNLTVSYPSDIKCGEEVTFKLLATGGSGTYKYRIASLTDAQQNFVYDISYGSNSVYGDSDEFKFTFYASGTYYIRFGVMDMGSTPYQTKTTGLLEYPIVINDPNYPSVEELVANVAGECEKSCSTDFDKAVWLHDWILDHADYDYTYSYCAAEGVLARGKGTCESYRAYVMLLNKVGIPTGRIAGNGHVWTAAQLDGKWYQIDSTWDDMGASYKGTFYEHLYFGLNDDIMKLVHSDHTQPVAGYECNSLEENYFIKTGEIHQWSDPFAEKIRQKIAAGETSFTLPVNSDLPESVANVIYRLVAYELSSESWTNATLSASYDNQKLTCSVTVKHRKTTAETMETAEAADRMTVTMAEIQAEAADRMTVTMAETQARTTETAATRERR